MEAVGLRQQIDQGGQSRGASFPDAIIDESGHHLTLSDDDDVAATVETLRGIL